LYVRGLGLSGHFDAHRERLFATLQAAGVGAGIVDVHPLHSDHPD